jgi:hypothetical protein
MMNIVHAPMTVEGIVSKLVWKVEKLCLSQNTKVAAFHENHLPQVTERQRQIGSRSRDRNAECQPAKFGELEIAWTV